MHQTRLMEAHLMLGGVDVNIDLMRVDLQIKHKSRLLIGPKLVFTGLTNGVVNEAVTHHAAVHVAILDLSEGRAARGLRAGAPGGRGHRRVARVHRVGERLAEKLNVPLLDKQLIAMAAKKSGLSEEVFEKADEKAGNSLLYSMVMGNYTFGSRITGINDMPINDKLFILQSDIIKSAADKGPCVIIGRCGDYILREYDNVFRVFIHANKEARIKRILSKGLCDEKKVSDFITKRDKQRANYYNFYSNKRWDDLSNYHLTIDSSEFDIDEVAEIIITAIGKIKPPAKK